MYYKQYVLAVYTFFLCINMNYSPVTNSTHCDWLIKTSTNPQEIPIQYSRCVERHAIT
jgi:hypothetical protein